MRVAFGMIGFLVVLGVMVWIMSAVYLPSTKAALDVKKKVEPQVQQMAGRDTSGEDARHSIKLDGETKNGRFTSVVVTAITPGGAMEKYFGLKRGDVIVEIAMQGGAFMPVSDMGNSGDTKDFLLSSYQNSQQIVVIRNEQRITLPLTPAPAAAGAKPAATPAEGSPDSLQKQLDAIPVPR